MTTVNRNHSCNMLRSQAMTRNTVCALPAFAADASCDPAEILCALSILIAVLGILVRIIL